MKDKIFNGKPEFLSKLPVLSLTPIFGLYYATYGAEKIVFTDEFIEYDFSPKSLRLI